MNYVDICPPAVVYQIQQADLRSAASSNLITWVEENSDRQCAIAAMEAIAARLTVDSDLSVIDLFCNAVASYAHMLDADQKAVIREAYFLGLRNTHIDLREELHGRVKINWDFHSPRRDAETWDYYLYLATMDEPGALEALAHKIAETKNGNDATLLLMSLAEVPGKGVDDILKLYANDKRTADAVDGPGLPISANVGLLFMMRGTN
jgi:hypothetical protein